MSRIVTVPVSLFLSMVEQIAAERPAYKLGHDGSDGLCDCIGLLRGALKRAGANPTNMRGTNEAARKSIVNLHKVKKAADLQLGQVVLKVRDMDDPDYRLPDKYRKGGSAYNGDLTNYTHIGVITRICPLRITHMTTPEPKQDFQLGKWIYVGDLPWVVPDTESGGKRMKASITSENGGPVNLRTEPNGKVVTKLPVGTEVEVITAGPKWSVIQYAGGTGYIMTAFLDIAGEEDKPDTITVTMTVAQAEELVQQIVKQIGRG